MRSIVVILLLSCCSIRAATISAISPSSSDVQAAVNSASSGDTVVVPAGSVTWPSAVYVNKAITVQGAGTNATIITSSRVGSFETCFSISPSSDIPIRITGFHFVLPYLPANNSCAVVASGSMTQLRIDNCQFDGGKRVLYLIQKIYGVVDHCVFYRPGIAVGITGDDNASWARGIHPGSTNAPYVEDCIFDVRDNAAETPIYQQEGGRIVVRHSTFSSGAAVEQGSFIEFHGNQTCYSGTSSDFRGQVLTEMYSNTLACDNGYRMVMDRGGTLLAFGNTFRSTNSPGIQPIVFTDEESWQTAFFSPLRSCLTHAILWPAQDQVTNTFIWGNTFNGGSLPDPAMLSGNDAIYIQGGRDYWLEAPSALNGRPAGVYASYTPLVYPHPLVSDSPVPPTPPPSPTIPLLTWPSALLKDALITSLTVSNDAVWNNSTTPGGTIQFAMLVATNGLYFPTCSVYGPSSDSNSWWFAPGTNNPAGNDQLAWDVTPLTTNFQSRVVSARGNGTSVAQFPTNQLSLNAGTNYFWIVGREPGAISNITFAPVMPPEPPPTPDPPPDPPPVPPVVISAFFATNGALSATSGGSVTCIVKRVVNSNVVSTVDYQTVDGTALAGRNYDAASGTLTFAAGDLETNLVLTILNDPIYRGDLAFSFQLTGGDTNTTLAAPTNMTVALQSAAVPAFLQFDVSGAVWSTVAQIQMVDVKRNGNTNQTTTVDWETVAGTALAGRNYVSTNATLTFLPGETSATVPIYLLTDSVYRGNLYFQIKLSNVSEGATINEPSTLLITLVPNTSPTSVIKVYRGTIFRGTAH